MKFENVKKLRERNDIRIKIAKSLCLGDWIEANNDIYKVVMLRLVEGNNESVKVHLKNRQGKILRYDFDKKDKLPTNTLSKVFMPF